MQRLQLEIEGMSCNHCVHAVQKALESIPGLQIEQVTVGSAVVQLADPSLRERARAAIEEEGYQVAREVVVD